MQYENISKYKYRLLENEEFSTGISGVYASTEYLTIYDTGILMCKKGYCWDGASGPTIDTDNTMRASLGHDALYQLIRLGVLNESHREAADKLLRKWLLEDGMTHVRAQLWYEGVRAFGGLHV
jgi:hypothetical protein